MQRVVTRVLALVMCALAAALAVAAALRTYDDNQRSWMVIGAVAAAVSALALLTSHALVRSLGELWRALRSEWSSR